MLISAKYLISILDDMGTDYFTGHTQILNQACTGVGYKQETVVIQKDVIGVQ